VSYLRRESSKNYHHQPIKEITIQTKEPQLYKRTNRGETKESSKVGEVQSEESSKVGEVQ